MNDSGKKPFLKHGQELHDFSDFVGQPLLYIMEINLFQYINRKYGWT